MSYSPVTETPSKPSRLQDTWSPTDPMDPTDSIDPTDQIDLGPLDFIPLGEGRAYTFGRKTIAVFRQRDGRLFATDNMCPHKAGPLADGLVGSGKVICPAAYVEDRPGDRSVPGRGWCCTNLSCARGKRTDSCYADSLNGERVAASTIVTPPTPPAATHPRTPDF